MTLADVEEECRTLLLIYLVDPVVTVVVTAPHVPRVKVLGKVVKPGKFVIQPGDTLLDAIAYAGGFDERCDIKRILILNKGSARLINLKGIINGEEVPEDYNLTLYDGDFIFVPEVGRPDWAQATSYVSGIIQSLIVVTFN